jgi:hypothetical protein
MAALLAVQPALMPCAAALFPAAVAVVPVVPVMAVAPVPVVTHDHHVGWRDIHRARMAVTGVHHHRRPLHIHRMRVHHHAGWRGVGHPHRHAG